jgi:hypothetical protein
LLLQASSIEYLTIFSDNTSMTRSELFRTNVGADPVEIGRNHRNDLQNMWYDDLRDALIALEKALKKILRTREYDPKKSSADLKEICTALQAKLMSDPDEIFDIVNMVGELSLVSARVEAIPVEKQEEKKFVAEVTIKENSTGATYSLSRILTINPSKLSKELIPPDQVDSIADSWTSNAWMKDPTPSVNTLSIGGNSGAVGTHSRESGPASIETIDLQDR